MIAVALGLISAVVMVATGVLVSSSAQDHLTFLGVGVETTTAQVFVTGAIFAWVFVVALWLLRLGMQRSGARCAELAGRWAGLGADGDAAEQGGRSGRPDPAGEGASAELPSGFVRPGLLSGIGLARIGLARIDLARIDLTRIHPTRIHRESSGRSGASANRGRAPGSLRGGPDVADLSLAPARDQSGSVTLDRTFGPGAGTVGAAAAAIGVRVRRRSQRAEVRSRPRAVPSEDRGPDGEDGQSGRGQ